MDRVDLSACSGDKPTRIEILDSREQVLTAQYLMQVSNASSKTVMDRGKRSRDQGAIPSQPP
jgi:hypothetical protein